MNQEACVVGVGVDFRSGDCLDDIVYVEKKEGCGDGAALRDSMGDGLGSGLGVLCV